MVYETCMARQYSCTRNHTRPSAQCCLAKYLEQQQKANRSETVTSDCLSGVRATPSPGDIRHLYDSLVHCFGPSMFRSPTLGGRHIDKGVYVDQLMRWRTLFKPEQFLIQTMESWESDPLGSLRRLLGFLSLNISGYSKYLSGDAKMSNQESNLVEAVKLMLKQKKLVTQNSRRVPLPPGDFREDLRRFYHPYNVLLEELLEERLGYTRS